MDTRLPSPSPTPPPLFAGMPTPARPLRAPPRPRPAAPSAALPAPPRAGAAGDAAPAPAQDALRAVAVVVEPLPLWLATRADPTLARAPLIAHDEARVVHANPMARRLGITQGMRLDGARLRAPGLEAVACHEPSLAQAWRDLTRELAGWTPWLDAGRRGRAFLRLPAAEAGELAARLDARVGIADDLETAELAALAARPGTAHTLPEGDGGFLARLPLRFLRGVGLPDRELTRLHWLGLVTVADLARWTPDQLHAYLADLADVLRPYLHGPRRREVPAWRPPAPLRRALAFDRLLFEPHEFEPALDRLARSLAIDLRGRVARHVTVATDGAGGARRATRIAKRPLHLAGQIRQQALFALRDSGAAALGVDALAIELAEPERRAEPVALWDARADRARAVDAVLERHPRALVAARWHDPHAPASDLAWTWAPLEDATPAVPHAPARARAAATPARRALEAAAGAVAPAAQHAAPPLLARPDRPLVDAPVQIRTDAERPRRPLSPAEGDAWAARLAAAAANADGTPTPAAATAAAFAPPPVAPASPPPPRDPRRDLLHDPDLVRAERWPGARWPDARRAA